MKAKLKQLHKVFKYKCGFLLFHGETTTCSAAFMLQIEVGDLLEGAVDFLLLKMILQDLRLKSTSTKHFNVTFPKF